MAIRSGVVSYPYITEYYFTHCVAATLAFLGPQMHRAHSWLEVLAGIIPAAWNVHPSPTPQSSSGWPLFILIPAHHHYSRDLSSPRCLTVVPQVPPSQPARYCISFCFLHDTYHNVFTACLDYTWEHFYSQGYRCSKNIWVNEQVVLWNRVEQIGYTNSFLGRNASFK